jgi:cell pole-organizing protein PopZ
MDDILASIRRILSEEETQAEPLDADATDDVFSLDESMLVAPPPASVIAPVQPVIEPPAVISAPQVPVIAAPELAPVAFAAPTTPLIAPAAATAAAASMGDMVRSLQAERHAAIYRGGPTIEDVVRAEIRPVLKEWLDTHLPSMVERIVRSEIERLAGRADV